MNRPPNTRTETAVGGLPRTLVGYDQWHPEIDHQAITSCPIINFYLPLKRVNGIGCHGFGEPVAPRNRRISARGL
jgi:hypothetical protein